MAEQLTALWQEAEEHLQAFQQYARRTVEEAWLAGDALMRIREQLPHGGWRSGLDQRGITKSTAHRFISLRKKYPEMSQLGTFSSVSAALTANSRKSEIGNRKSNTELPPQEEEPHPPAQPKLLEEPQEQLQVEPQAAQAHDEPTTQPQAAQVQNQPPAQPQAAQEQPTVPQPAARVHDQPAAQTEAREEPQPAARAQEQPQRESHPPASRRSISDLRFPISGGSPPFRRRPPPKFRAPTAPAVRAAAVQVPDVHELRVTNYELRPFRGFRLRTPRLTLPGSHTSFRLGLACFVDVDDAAENKNAAPTTEQRHTGPAADKRAGDKM